MKELLRRRHVDVAVIPGGLTPVLQPLDKALNKPFKAHVRDKYLSWMVNGPFEYSPAGKKKAPSKDQVLRWIHEAWQGIPPNMIQRSFKSCGISNSLDGTEDELVYQEPDDNTEYDEELENEFETDSEEENDD